MQVADQMSIVVDLTGETDSDRITRYLNLAGAAILNRLYSAYTEPPEGAEVPEKYQMLQCQLAVRYIARRGGYGEISHSEGGVSRSWASPDDADLLNQVTPKACIPS